MRHLFFIGMAGLFAVVAVTGLITSPALWGLAVLAVILLVGIWDTVQKQHAVRRNFPVVGHFRYVFEAIRPEINQYFIESNTDGTPFNREVRSLVYQRAKGELDTLPFGTQRDVYEAGYEFMVHSIAALEPPAEEPRVVFGEKTCAKPYSSSLLNISAMSFGSLSKNALLALSKGARAGGFAHNTGEGGLSPYHLAGGADLIWQIGTGYFGCRDAQGRFDPALFEERAAHDQVRMIEVKLSQGAKPGHGGILPAAKVTPEIAAIRHVPVGEDVLSPPQHSAFSTPVGLLEFVARLRELSGGKPVGFKLCMGDPTEFLSICKAMRASGLRPDFVTIDGGEGGTGAAPFEFSNSLGVPLTEGLVLAHGALVGFELREDVRLVASGKIASGFDMARRMALGADVCSAARSMMLAVGCIQARRCNTNKCPVGVATQDPRLVQGLVVEDKAPRVERYHRETVESFLELIAAAGIAHPSELERRHVWRRLDRARVESYARLYELPDPGALLAPPIPRPFDAFWDAARPDRFR